MCLIVFAIVPYLIKCTWKMYLIKSTWLYLELYWIKYTWLYLPCKCTWPKVFDPVVLYVLLIPHHLVNSNTCPDPDITQTSSTCHLSYIYTHTPLGLPVPPQWPTHPTPRPFLIYPTLPQEPSLCGCLATKPWGPTCQCGCPGGIYWCTGLPGKLLAGIWLLAFQMEFWRRTVRFFNDVPGAGRWLS